MEVTGVDVSPSMLRRPTQLRCCGANRVQLVQGDDISRVRGPFDFVHTYIVLQHIPVERVSNSFASSPQKLAPGGVGMFHVPYTPAGRDWRPKLSMASHEGASGRWALNLARGRAVSAR